jgi:hypothetical protein
VNVDIPGEAALNWADVKAIVIAGFFEEKSVQDLALSQTLAGYFRDELKTRVRASLAEKPIAWPSADALEAKEIWKGAADGPIRTLILTGKAAFSRESRKALVEGERREIDEGPFKPVSPWAAKKAFSLKLDFALIDASTGEVAFRRNFQETLATDNTRQTAAFALYELMSRIRSRLFRALFGIEQPQDRYLLAK